MNALAGRTLRQLAGRGSSMKAPIAPQWNSQIGSSRTKMLNMHISEKEKKQWVSDKGTYPIVVIIGGAVVLCVGFMGFTLTCNSDVRVTSEARGTLIRPKP